MIDEAAIVAAALTGWGREIVGLAPLFLGHDPRARTYRATTRDGRDLFLKWRSRLDAGMAVSQALYAAGATAVLAPISTKEGRTAQATDEGWLLAYPFVEGHNGFYERLTLDRWRAFGGAMREIHAAVVPAEVLAQVEVETFDPPEFEILKRFVEDPPEPLRAPIERHRAALERILRGTRKFGQACREKRWTMGLCHADIHVGNVHLTPDGGLRIVDWDEPRIAPRERDLMFICGGGIMSGHGAAEEAAFFEGYGPASPDPLGLTYYRFAWATMDLSEYLRATFHPATDDASCGREASESFERLFQPGEVVDLAFRSEDAFKTRSV
ncbi:aminoglycoside phosphotransferase family protein [bacterium]|nr:MAG: aminoglycoside phosphotransferase family protein [bacterium]